MGTGSRCPVVCITHWLMLTIESGLLQGRGRINLVLPILSRKGLMLMICCIRNRMKKTRTGNAPDARFELFWKKRPYILRMMNLPRVSRASSALSKVTKMRGLSISTP